MASGKYRESSWACSEVREVPREATALSNPAWCREMVSIYPSVRMTRPALDFLAMFRANTLRLLLYTGVSGEFRYLGVESSITRPPKPMTSPRMSMMGNMTRLRNRS